MSLQHIADFLDALDQQPEHISEALEAQLDAIFSYLDHPLYRKQKKEGFPTVRLGGEGKAELTIYTLFEQANLTEENVRSLCGKFRIELTRLYAKAMAASESVPTQLRDHWVGTVKVLYGGQQKLLDYALEECRRSSIQSSPVGLNNVPDHAGNRQELEEHFCRATDARAELLVLQEKKIATVKNETQVNRKNRMTVEQANQKAMKLARKMRAGFFALSMRQQAEQIGCSWTTWSRTTFFAKSQGMRPGANHKKPSSPKTVSLTAERESVTGEGDRDEVATIVADSELQRLIAEQNTDHEPSPLEEATPGRRRKIHFRKRL